MMPGRSGALQARRVLEIADESGVYCGKLLADMGADVIKIERPGGDPCRSIPPLLEANADTPLDDDLRSLFFLFHNTNKRSLTLDWTRPEARDLFRRLAASADLILETLPVGRLEALDLDWKSLSREHPRLVLTSITGFGQSGPHRHFMHSDAVVNAMAGTSYVTGEAEDPPVVQAGMQAYLMASTCAAASSLVALHSAARNGRGQHVDISCQEVMLSVAHITGVGKWRDDGIVPRRMGAGLFASVPSGNYRCQDGSVYLMVNRPAHWKALAEWIHEETGNEEVLDPLFEGPSSRRQEYRLLLDLFIGELTERHTVAEIFHEGQRRHIAFTPLNDLAAVERDPQLRARGFFEQLEDESGCRSVAYPGAPYRHERTPWKLRHPAPHAGQHNHEILCDELGLSDEQLAALRTQGVV